LAGALALCAFAFRGLAPALERTGLGRLALLFLAGVGLFHFLGAKTAGTARPGGRAWLGLGVAVLVAALGLDPQSVGPAGLGLVAVLAFLVGVGAGWARARRR